MSVYAIGSNIGPQVIVIAMDVDRHAAVRQSGDGSSCRQTNGHRPRLRRLIGR